MSEQGQEEGKKPEQNKLNPKFQQVLDNLSEEAATGYSTEFDKMVHSNEWTIDNQTLQYQMQNRKRLGQLKALQALDIDEAKDWDGYTDNICKRACLLVKDMKPELFDELPFYEIENLVTAWSVRANRGFHKTVQPTT